MQEVILIMGPTASGKTDLAIEIAKSKNCQIISVDSALVYKDMNIGTAKPDAQTLKDFPHSLVDIITPDLKYSVQNFIRDAKNAIELAINQEKTPILVGGTPFYFNALQNGLSDLPASTAESRVHFDELLKNKGSAFMHQELTKIDKVAAQRIHPNDSQRVSRALEVYFLSGKTMTSLQNNKTGAIKNPLKKLVLMPPRNILHQRIEARFKQMLDFGFIDEVKNLQQKYDLTANMASMRSVGYRQIWQYLAGEVDKDEAIELGIIATRQLCKRQSTWFKVEKNAQFLENNDINNIINYL